MRGFMWSEKVHCSNFKKKKLFRWLHLDILREDDSQHYQRLLFMQTNYISHVQDVYFLVKVHVLMGSITLRWRSDVGAFIFDIWYIFKAHAGDVECSGKYLCDQKIISTHRHPFQINSENFPGKFRGNPGRGNFTFVRHGAWKPPWDHSFTPRQMTTWWRQTVNPWIELKILWSLAFLALKR